MKEIIKYETVKRVKFLLISLSLVTYTNLQQPCREFLMYLTGPRTNAPPGNRRWQRDKYGLWRSCNKPVPIRISRYRRT